MPTPTGMEKQDVHVTVGADTHADVHVAAALDQLARPVLQLRRVTVTHGFPILPRAVRIGRNALLVPFDMALGYGQLWRLLATDCQRDVRQWGGGNGLFLLQDETVQKRGSPEAIDVAAARLNDNALQIIGDLRMAYEGPVYVSRAYLVQISSFPFLRWVT